jgi:hypothetical protein
MLLARHGVVHLRSPRAWPQYNGACEAGIGLLRSLSDRVAGGRGLADYWTAEDLEAARALANRIPRYRGVRLVRPAREWRLKRRIGVGERRRFRDALRGLEAKMIVADPDARRHRQRIRRKAIQTALVDLGYLEIRAGWTRARKLGRGRGQSYR